MASFPWRRAEAPWKPAAPAPAPGTFGQHDPFTLAAPRTPRWDRLGARGWKTLGPAVGLQGRLLCPCTSGAHAPRRPDLTPIVPRVSAVRSLLCCRRTPHFCWLCFPTKGIFGR